MEGLEKLANAKEKELNNIRQQLDQQVTNTIKSLEETLCKERHQLSQLQGDFNYNLSLLSARDKELAQYETSFRELKRVVNALVAETSELKVRLDGVCQEMEGEKSVQLQLKAHHQCRIKELHSRMADYRRVKQREVDEERGKLEGLQRELQRRLLAVEEETESQRDHMMADFEETMKQRDHDHQLRRDQLSSAILTSQSRSQKLERDLAHAQSDVVKLQKELSEKASECVEVVRLGREELWRVEGEVKQLEECVREWQSKHKKLEGDAKKMQETFQRKHEELDRRAREGQANLEAAKQVHQDCEQSVQQQCGELHATMEQRQGEWTQREAVLQQTIKDKEELLERANKKHAVCQDLSNQQVKTLNKLKLDKDRQLASTDKWRQDCKKTLKEKEKELISLETKLCEHQNREQAMELRHAEQQLNWEGRLREAEKMAYFKQQERMKNLTEANLKLEAERQEVLTKLNEQADHCELLERREDAALAVLHKHNIPWEHRVTAHVTELQKLQSQNGELHRIIKQMRTELEQLSEQAELEQKQRPEKAGEPAIQYITYLENDICKLKSENSQLSGRLTQVSKPPTPRYSQRPADRTSPGTRSDHKDPTVTMAAIMGAAGAASEESPADRQIETLHRDQLVALSATIASLQKEKQQLERNHDECKDKVRQLQDKLKEEKEMVYLMKARHTPQTKLHQKLLQATHVIISLVREKQLLSTHIEHLVSATPFSSKTHGQEGWLAAKKEVVVKCVQTSPWQCGQAYSSSELQEYHGQGCLRGGGRHKEAGIVEEDDVLRGNETRREITGDRRERLDCGDFQIIRSGKKDPSAKIPDKKESLPESINISVADGKLTAQHKADDILTEVGSWDQSLPSLQFSESSLEGGAAALEQVLEMVDKTLVEEWSSEDVNEKGTRRSTPEPREREPRLELVGTEMKTHIRQSGQVRMDPRQRKNRTHSAGNVGVGSLRRSKTGCMVNGQSVSQLKPSSSASRNIRARKPRNYNVKD